MLIRPPNCRYKNFNDEQYQAIVADAKNIFVSASAGSGKTTVMIERVLRLLESGASLLSMVICTFTRASASDMRSKLLDKLLVIINQNPNTSWAKEALNNLGLASICTIDSFCTKIAREYFYYSDIDPYFESIEPVEADSLLELSIIEELEERLVVSEPSFLYIYEALSPNRSDKHFVSLIKKVYDMMVVQPDSEQWLNISINSLNNHDKYITQLEGLVQKHGIKYPDNPIDPILTIESVKAIIDICLGIKVRYTNYKAKKAKLDFRDVAKEAHKILQNKEANEIITSRFKFVFVDEFQDIDPLQNSIFSLFNVNKFFVGDVKQSIYQFRLSDPSIFISHLDKANKDNDNISIELKKNYRSDTAILKFCDNIFSDLMSKNFGGVGYAEGGAFGISGLGERFKPNVFINIVDKSLEEGSLKNCETKNTADLPQIYSVMLDECGKGSLSEDDGEITLIVRHILSLKEKSITLKNGQQRKVEFGDIVILLRSMGSFATKLCIALEKCGIFFNAQKETSFSDKLAILDLINYLKLVDNSLDDIVLASVLKSPFLGGFTDEELLNIRLLAKELQKNKTNKKQRKEFFIAIKEILDMASDDSIAIDVALKYKLNDFYNSLEQIRTLKSCMSIAQLAGEIVARNSVFNKIVASENFQKIIDELSLFLDSIVSIDSSLSFKAQLIMLEQLSFRGFKQDLDSSSVRIMTIHSSKGLEFPFVIVGNLDRDFNRKGLYDAVLIDNDFGVSLKHFDIASNETIGTSLWHIVSEKAKFKAQEEELRLLYVALTRAEYQVALFATKDKNFKLASSIVSAKNPLQWLYPLVNRMAYSVEFSPNECLEIAKQNLETQKSCNIVIEDDGNHYSKNVVFSVSDTKRQLQNFKYPHKKIPLKASVTALVTDSRGGHWSSVVLQELNSNNITLSSRMGYTLKRSEPIVDEQSSSTIGNNAGIEIGNAHHKFFEVYNFEKSAIENWQSFQKRFADYSKLLSLLKLEKSIEKLKTHIANRENHREMQFLYKQENGTLVQGIIDLLIIDENGIEIIDYKSGKIDEAKKEIYKNQLENYAIATAEILNKKVIAKKVFSLTTAEFMDL
ncbi:MAG: UvrD-helicase domain-containing protein [Firmicutes bacterium]|nr:UvrD-helicase domain-containing protein [Bacillota bacterium]